MAKTMVSRFSGKKTIRWFFVLWGYPISSSKSLGFSYWNPWWRLGTAVRLASSCRWIQCSSYPRCTAPSRADAPSGLSSVINYFNDFKVLENMPKICKYCSKWLLSLLLSVLLLILSKSKHILHPNHSHTGFCLGSEICLFCNTFATRTNLNGCSNQVNPEADKTLLHGWLDLPSTMDFTDSFLFLWPGIWCASLYCTHLMVSRNLKKIQTKANANLHHTCKNS